MTIIPPRSTPGLILALILAAALDAASTTAGQPEPAGADARLQTEPFVAGDLGVRLRLPLNARVKADAASGDPVFRIIDGAAEPTWHLLLREAPITDLASTAASIGESYLDAIRAQGARIRDLRTETIDFGGSEPGWFCLFESEPANGVPTVYGRAILPNGTQTYIDLRILARPAAMPRFEPTLRAALATLDITPRRVLLSQTEAAMQAGRDFLDDLTTDQLLAAAHEPLFFRIYRPADSGRAEDEKEIAWLSIEAREAMKGEVDPSRPVDRLTPDEREPGVLVTFLSRAIEDAGAGYYISIERRFWMSLDGLQELWSGRMTRRQGDASATTGETGVRSGLMLTVITSTADTFGRDAPRDWVIPDQSYLSQPILFLLGALLPKTPDVVENTYEWYVYDHLQKRLPRRHDVWSRAPDREDRWQLKTTFSADGREITQIYDADGRLLRRVDDAGVLTVRSTRAEIERMWRSKGLRP